MIAIAGVKGGCGKTTTTLALAEAFGRTGTPVIAVDADRQLPNLHVRAGIDRRPTLAAVTDDDVRRVAQRKPESTNVDVLPAPTADERVDVASAIETFDLDSTQVILDCPSGAGPDAVDPISVADAVIVVTTDDERSLEGAETTIEMATRLGTPILGTVVTQCGAVPDDVRSWLDVPVLGRLPDADAPLSNADVRDAADEVVRTLRRRNATARTLPGSADELLATGIDALDRRLGGVSPGTVVALTADPASQAEQLLYQATAPRGTLYVTTRRSARNVERALESSTLPTGAPTVRRLNRTDPLAQLRTMLEKLPDGATLVVDAMTTLERCDEDDYAGFVDALEDRIVATGSVAFLYCPNRDSPPSNRPLTTHFADVVLDLETVVPETGAAVEHYLSVPKHRANCGFSETIELAFDGASDAVTVPETNEQSSRQSDQCALEPDSSD
ncbi:AAA family ATPase [Natronolimnohabitans sp. A-GB9]|uniref:DUF7125 family protein n=1 Tax=Natronolimnohabitans sp. A-GB9 TaxID=3069757 RepID=UPI0027AF8E61|nr:AAA family ATPase [Natronolimnohabitans sp. A-GB9]MDQ2050906.1 AAA family ATPase [Natronolimnohabitans sp. A-GB9]